MFQVKEAKTLFDHGALKGWYLDQYNDEWILYLETKKDGDHQLYCSRGDLRYFKTVDFAVKVVKSIGFDVSRLR